MTPLKLALLGEGAIARSHAREIAAIDRVQIEWLLPGVEEAGAAFAAEFGIPNLIQCGSRLEAQPDGVIIASPSDLHSTQARGAFVLPMLIEIPMATTREDCESLVSLPHAMVAHTRRFSPAHLEMKARLQSGEVLHHLVAETYFHRRQNLNMLGQPRSCVDRLIWHHAVHSIDLFLWLTEDPEPQMAVMGGRVHPEMGCLMDATITLRAKSGQMLSLVMSFNNTGPFGGFYRYICEGGTFHVFRDELKNREGMEIPVSGPPAFTAQAQAFVAALGGNAPFSPTPAEALPAMRLAAGAAEALGVTR